MIFRKPSEDGAEVLTAQQVRKARLGGTQFRLVRVEDRPREKVRPVGGEWPPIVESGEIERDGVTGPRLITIATRQSDKYERVWYFEPDTKLCVVTAVNA